MRIYSLSLKKLNNICAFHLRENNKKEIVFFDPKQFAEDPELSHLIRYMGISNFPVIEKADLVPLLMNCIKELNARVTALEKGEK